MIINWEKKDTNKSCVVPLLGRVPPPGQSCELHSERKMHLRPCLRRRTSGFSQATRRHPWRNMEIRLLLGMKNTISDFPRLIQVFAKGYEKF